MILRSDDPNWIDCGEQKGADEVTSGEAALLATAAFNGMMVLTHALGKAGLLSREALQALEKHVTSPLDDLAVRGDPTIAEMRGVFLETISDVIR